MGKRKMKLSILKRTWRNTKNAFRSIKSAKTVVSKENLAKNRLNAQKQMAFIPESSWLEMSENIFSRQCEPASKFLANLKAVREYCAQTGLAIPDDVVESLTILERKGTTFATRMNRSISKGIEPQNVFEYSSKFKEKNKKHFDIITDFTEHLQEYAMKAMRDVPYNQPELHRRSMENFERIGKTNRELRYFNIEDTALFNPKIGPVNEGILIPGQTFYHGTGRGNAKGIKKHGFSLLPKAHQAMDMSRELGEGVYLTTSKRVASNYAGLSGNILHTHINTQNMAVVNNFQLENVYYTIQNTVGKNTSLSPELTELIIKELFQRNGYQSVYTRQALGKNRKVIDALSGGKQSQVVVFNPNDITLLEKSCSQRLYNQMQQIATFFKAPINYLKGYKEALLNGY